MKDEFKEYVDIICLSLGHLAFIVTALILLMHYTDFTVNKPLAIKVMPALFVAACSGFIVCVFFRLLFGIVIYGLDPDDSWTNFWRSLTPLHSFDEDIDALGLGIFAALFVYLISFAIVLGVVVIWPVILVGAVLTGILYLGKYLLDRGKQDWKTE